jgi:hypothetical protein
MILKQFSYWKVVNCIIAFILYGCTQHHENHLPSLNETFFKNNKKPFGSFVAYHHFKNLFNGRYVETINRPFDEAWNEMKEYSTNSRYSLYVLITKNLAVNDNEADAMLTYIKEGNDLFISADYIDRELLDKINCQTDRDSEIIREVAGKMNETYVKINRQQQDSAGFKYYYYPFLNFFTEYDSLNTRILGFNEMSKPNFILLFMGKGRLYLHAAPRTFSNYFLLSHNNYKYLDDVLSYLRTEPKNIFWDEYYKNKSFRRKGNGSGNGNQTDRKAFSSFNVINSHPPLLWAFWLSVITILLFILFNIKRKQRIIHEIKPNSNTTVVFTETVGRLYLEKKNNKNIAEKMITYFYEHIRNKYFMNTARINDEFMNVLSRKTGVEEAIVQNLFNTIKSLQSREDISDTELLSLNRQIQNFYKNKI